LQPELGERLVTWLTSREWSEDDYYLFANDHNVLIELVDGRVVLQEMPTPRHQAAVVALARALGDSRLGQVFVAPIPVRLAEGRVREPDVVFVASAHKDRVRDQHVDIPDLVLEVLSPATRSLDLGEKLKEYENAAVPEYWVVDLTDGSIDVRRHTGQGYRPPQRYEKGAHTVPGCAPDVSVAVDRVVAASS
jgi:Uma2 family endonuclease